MVHDIGPPSEDACLLGRNAIAGGSGEAGLLFSACGCLVVLVPSLDIHCMGSGLLSPGWFSS